MTQLPSHVVMVTDCVFRTRRNVNENTHEHTLHCGNAACPHNGREVFYPICATCPFKKDGPETVIPVPTPAIPPSEPRPDLQAIALTLPAPRPEDAEQTFQRPQFNADGSISYPKAKGDWEPPQIPSGYARDPKNKWLFHPLWKPCALRHQSAFVKAACGCIDVRMLCHNPQAAAYGTQVAYETCTACPVRKT